MSGPRIKDIPASERPRERLAASGADSLGNSELIAILLRTGLQGKSALVIGQELLAKFRTLDRLSKAAGIEQQHEEMLHVVATRILAQQVGNALGIVHHR